MYKTNIYTKTVEIIELKRITFYGKKCEHNSQPYYCKFIKNVMAL